MTCDTDNTGSRKVIEAAGGTFEDERGGKLRYWISTARIRTGRPARLGHHGPGKAASAAAARRAGGRAAARGTPAEAEGCLAFAIRVPVRIVVLVLVVPVRLVWDALAVCGRFLWLKALRPAGRAVATVLTWLFKSVFVWPWVGLWRYVLVPVGKGLAWLGHVLLVVPLTWLYARVLTPIGHGIAWVARGIGAGISLLGRGTTAVVLGIGAGIAWLGRMLLVVPAVWLYARVLTPIGHGIAWLARGIGAGAMVAGRGVGAPWSGSSRPSSSGRGWACGGMWSCRSGSDWPGWGGCCS